MRFKLLFVVPLVYLLLNGTLYSDANYPNSISFADVFDGGKVYVSNICLEENLGNQSSLVDYEPSFYFLKTSWVIDNEAIYFWKGLKQKNLKGASIGNAYILDAALAHNKLFLVVSEKNQIYVTTFDTVLNINQKLLIDSSSSLINYSNTFNLKNIQFVVDSKSNQLFLLNNNYLYKINISDPNSTDLSLQLIATDVLGCNFCYNRDDFILSYIEDKKNYSLVYTLDKNNTSHYIAKLPVSNKDYIFSLQTYLVVVNSSYNQNDALFHVIDINSKNILFSEWIKANTNLMDADKENNTIYTLTSEKGSYKLNQIPIPNFNTGKIKSVNLPKNLCSPMKLVVIDNWIYIFFKNALVVYDTKLNEIIFDYYDFSNFLFNDLTVTHYDNYLILASSNTSLVFNITDNPFWLLNRQISNTYRFAVPIILIVIIFVLFRKYRNQKRLLDAIIDLPSSGVVFIINRAGRLIKVNEGGKLVLDISDNIQIGKQFNYYCKSEQAKQIAEIVDRGLSSRASFQQKINIIIDNNPRELFCSLIPLRNIAGRFIGVVITGVDITEELERQMLISWAQLAHDMQTNLSTIRLNAEQISTHNDEELQRRNKIIYQVNILIQRVRDIVTVGRTDKLEKITVNSIDFCTEIRNEFDDNLFSKIQFKMNLTDFNFICDKPKLSRAVRNAVENAIKSMKNKGGLVTISCNKDIHNIIISIKDTGIGMDEATKNKIFTPFFSTARKEGGSGIGTMIMQRVIDLHGGKLIIESKLGVGTEIIFQIPDMSRRKS